MSMNLERPGSNLRRLAGLMLLLVFCLACRTAPSISPAPAEVATATPLAISTAIPNRVPSGLYIDASRRLGRISRLVYGTNHGPWSIVPHQLLPQAEAAGISYLRFPGGNWGDRNNLRSYQVDQFIALARRMGAEPSISVRLRGGTPEQAADLVSYANIEKGYGVRYWTIGNEPELYGDYDTERYNREWRAVAEAMLRVDPDIVLVGPDVTQYTTNIPAKRRDGEGRDWIREFLLANGDLVDIVSIHRYPFPVSKTNPTVSVEELLASTREWNSIIRHLRTVIRETTGRYLPVAVTEANTHWTHATGGETTPDSFYAALWWGDVLGRLIRQRVEIVAHFTLQSKAQTGGWGLLESYDVRPAYYVYQLYQRFGQELVYTASDDADVSIFGALREDGALTLMVVNLGPKERHKDVNTDGFEAEAPAEVWLFDSEHRAESIAPQLVWRGSGAVLPGHSITLILLPAASARG